MALKYPDRLESNNPSAYGIVKSTEVAGHKLVLNLTELYALADPILSVSGNNTNDDAIGLEWYVQSESKYYRLMNWAGRKSASGWMGVLDTSSLNTSINAKLDQKVDKTTTVNGHALSSNVTVTKTDVGLGNVDNTSDLNKPISTATQTALNNKVDKVTGKGLSTNDYTDEDKDLVNSLKSENANVGDVCFYDKENDRLIIASEWSAETHPATKYTPIGVVVIPSSHNVWGNGKAGVMSLRAMRYDTPETGGLSEQTIYWGQYGINTELKNFDKVVTTDKGAQSYGYIDSSYNKPTSNIIPLPFNEDGSRNPAYYDTSLTDANAMSDFDGIGNTNVLIGLATAQSDWKTADTITNSSSKGYSPAACCCWRYHTPGTNPGDWYLPACGELGYAEAKKTEINKVISDLNSVYGSIALSLDDFYYWSSSVHDKWMARIIYLEDGGIVTAEYKEYYYYVRAFLQVPVKLSTIDKNIFEVGSKLNEHISDTNNPHSVTKSQVGLSNVTNDALVKRSEMGIANGVATLDSNGKIPSSQLPSYVDDIIDVYATYTKSNTGVLTNISLYSDAAKTKPITGESGKIYLNITSGEPSYQFRWTGSTFAQTGASSLIIGEVSGTAYDGAKGKANAQAIAAIKSVSLSHINNENPITATKEGVSINYECYSGDQYGGTSTKHTIDLPLVTETTAGIIDPTLVLYLFDKVDPIKGKGLSTNDYTNEDRDIVNSFKEANVGDICFYDKEHDKLIIESKFSRETHPLDKFTPIGIVVIPSSHDVYGTGEVAIMSLAEMDYNAPDTGSVTSHPAIKWGQSNVNTTLFNFYYLTGFGYFNNPSTDFGATGSNGYIPTDFSTGDVSIGDSNRKWWHETGEYVRMPSPFLTDGSRNPLYFDTSVTPNNATSDFNGVANTQTLIELATAQSDWKTASTITNSGDAGYSPTACCCWRFHTDGTKLGDWYQPACGELGYVPANKEGINQHILYLNIAYGKTLGVLLSSDRYWSSSEYGGAGARDVSGVSGYVGQHGKANLYLVRAFLRVSKRTLSKEFSDIDKKLEEISNYKVNNKPISSNPTLNKSDIGLSNVTNDAQVKRSEMAKANGVATLDANTKVPIALLPLTNMVDNEDVTIVDNKIKFKDRPNTDGMGYVVLRKAANGSILTLGMINQPNTVYEIRYDFNLNNATINIPANCVLKFEGGSFRNGTINFNLSTLIGIPRIYTNVSGYVLNPVLIEWFYNGVESTAVVLNRILQLHCPVHLNSNKTYTINENILMGNSSSIIGNNDSTLNITSASIYVGSLCKISNCNIYVLDYTNPVIVINSDHLLNTTDNYNFNINYNSLLNIYIEKCKIRGKSNSDNRINDCFKFESTGSGLSGWNITVSDVLVIGFWQNAFKVFNTNDTGDQKSWLNDITYLNCKTVYCQVGWYLGKSGANSVPPEKVNILGCSMQADSLSRYFCEADAVHRLHIDNSEAWDWQATTAGTKRCKFTSSCYEVKIANSNLYNYDWEDNGGGYAQNTISLDSYYTGLANYSDMFPSSTLRVGSDGRYILRDLLLLPKGTYSVQYDSAISQKLGVGYGGGGLLISIGGYLDKTVLFYIPNKTTHANSGNPLLFIDFNTFYILSSHSLLAGNDVLDRSVTTNDWMKFVSSSFLTGALLNKPQLLYSRSGTIYCPNEAGKLASPIFWDGNVWRYVSGGLNTNYSIEGTTANRPSLQTVDKGFLYFDTTLNRYITWNGTAWVDPVADSVSWKIIRN